MRILATADVHVHNWTQYSDLDNNGVYSRLKCYETLGQDLSQLAKTKEVDLIVVAGDIFHQAVSPPSVLYYGKRFIEEISANLPTIMVIGQHDCDSKAQTNNPLHSVVPPILPTRDNLVYVQSSQLVEVGGVKVWAHSWVDRDPNSIHFAEADIFVGHGIVSGSIDPHGYQFLGGFDAKELSRKYALSIVGDLHKEQWIDKVLIPGVPIQNSWKDSPNPGVWLVDFKDGEVVDQEHVSIYDLRDDGTYHRFLTSQETSVLEGARPPSGTHWKIKTRTFLPNKAPLHGGSVGEVESAEDFSSILFGEHSKHVAKENLAASEELLRLAYEKSDKSSSITAVADSRILRVSGQHFQSMKRFEWDFRTHGGDTVFLGTNGSGKTTVAELIYWVLTGEVTKASGVKSVYSIQTKKAPEGSIDLSIGTQIYRIHRSRTAGPVLDISLLNSDGEEIQALNKSTVKSSQETIYKLLGLSQHDIRMVSYYSSQQPWTFSGLGKSDRQDILGQLVGSSLIDSIRDAAKAILDESKKESHTRDGELLSLEAVIRQLSSRASVLKSKMVKADTSHLRDKISSTLGEAFLDTELSDVIQECNRLTAKLQSTLSPNLTTRALEMSQELSKFHQKESGLTADYKQSMDSVRALKGNLIKAREGSCFHCGQPLRDDSMVESLTEKMQAESKKSLSIYQSLKEIKPEGNRLAIRQSEIESLMRKNDEITKEMAKYKSLLSLINNLPDLTLNEKIRAQLLEIATQIEENQASLANVNEAREQIRKRIRIGLWLTQTFLARSGPLVAAVNEIACRELSKELNELSLGPEVYSAKVVGGKSPDIEVSFLGQTPMSIEQMSGGEKRVNDIMVMVAIINLFSKRFSLPQGPLGLSIFDEVFSYLDDKYTDLAIGALDKCLSGSKFIITHDQRIQSYFSRMVRVEKEQGVSTYQVIS